MSLTLRWTLFGLTTLTACGSAPAPEEADDVGALAADSAFDATITRFNATDHVALGRYRADPAVLAAFRSEIDALKARGMLDEGYLALSTRLAHRIDDVDHTSDVRARSCRSPRAHATRRRGARRGVPLHHRRPLAPVNGALRASAGLCKASHPAACPARDARRSEPALKRQ